MFADGNDVNNLPIESARDGYEVLLYIATE